MNKFILGNIIALIGATFSIILGAMKDRKKAISVQTVQFFTYSISNYILGGFSGAIVNLISAIRNILSYKEKLTSVAIVIIIIVSTTLVFSFNNLGFIGLFPLLNLIIYTTFINTKDLLKFKLLFLVTVILWLVYDFTIKAYTSVIFDFITIITCIISAYKIYKSQQNTDNKEIKKEQQQN